MATKNNPRQNTPSKPLTAEEFAKANPGAKFTPAKWGVYLYPGNATLADLPTAGAGMAWHKLKDLVVVSNREMDAGEKAREAFDTLKGLADSIQGAGLIQPPSASGKTILLGRRRISALRLLDDSGETWVRVAEGDSAATLPENTQRKGLHPWEIGDQVVDYKDKDGKDWPEIEKLAGYSIGYCQNVYRAVKDLDPMISKAWREGKITTKTVWGLLKKNHAEQRADLGMDEAGNLPEKGSRGRADSSSGATGSQGGKPTEKAIRERLADLKAGKLGEVSSAFVQGQIAALGYVLGESADAPTKGAETQAAPNGEARPS